jgi:uncharacterized damage-inducible protein DinB
MTKNMIAALFEYNTWANAKILEKAGLMSDDQLTTPTGYSHGSLRELLLHMMRTEWVWRKLCQFGAITQPLPHRGDMPTLDAIQARWAQEEELLRAYLDGLSDADLKKIVHLKDRDGNMHSYELWGMLMHLLLHSMQHRSEAAVILTDFGHSPGDLDLIFFLGERGES